MHHKWHPYAVWLYRAWQTEDFVILEHFFYTFTTPNNLKNYYLEKMRKPPQDIIILHMCTTNINHMMNGSWDIEHDGQNFLSFWTVFFFVFFFCLFTPLTTQKIKILNNEKRLKILFFYTCVAKMTIIWCMVPDTSSATDTISCHFGPFFCTCTPLITGKIKLLKNWKICLEVWSFYTSEVSSFYTSVPKIMITCYTAP